MFVCEDLGKLQFVWVVTVFFTTYIFYFSFFYTEPQQFYEFI